VAGYVPTRSAALVHASGAPTQIEGQPRRISALAGSPAALPRGLRYLSPLRYPGAKSALIPVISDLVSGGSRVLGHPALFVEPFAGGASTGLRLIVEKVVDRILLADADSMVARFWQVAASETEWLIDRMWAEPVTLERWDYWRRWTPKRIDDRETAVKCLFLNRTTFSGILHGRAGPIGGRRQSSAYKLDCRFNKEGLEKRLRLIGGLYSSRRIVDVWCKDWRQTLADVAEWYPHLLPNRVIAYLDPPYLVLQ
jgi:DNA adenine methylase